MAPKRTSDQVVSIWRRRKVEEMVGLSRSQIYALIKRGQFPEQVSLGARAVGWRSSDIDNWIATRVSASQAIH